MTITITGKLLLTGIFNSYSGRLHRLAYKFFIDCIFPTPEAKTWQMYENLFETLILKLARKAESPKHQRSER
jgi:hypothetical protein